MGYECDVVQDDVYTLHVKRIAFKGPWVGHLYIVREDT
jgi:hypothetical protein